MLKREKSAMHELYNHIDDMEAEIANPDTITTEHSLSIDLDDNLELLLRNLVSLVRREKLKLWHRIAFAIVVQVVDKLIFKKILGKG
jgi:hypothetical protein